MTAEEFKKIELTWVSHTSMTNEHVTTFVNADYGLIVHRIQPFKDGMVHGKQKVEYYLNGKQVSRKKLLTMI